MYELKRLQIIISISALLNISVAKCKQDFIMHMHMH